MTTQDPYASLGIGYADARREDPRIAAQIHAALDVGATVLNIGAGAGSYEPRQHAVTAIEPSEVMRQQRAADRPDAIDAHAESLPFADDEFDVALAIFTVHHWLDPQAGLAEMKRVSRRQVIVTWDAARMAEFWLVADYLPEIAEQEAGLVTHRELMSWMTRDVRTHPLLVPADCTDGFLAAYWARPEMYLSAERRAAASGLAKLPREVIARGMTDLERDLADGTWHARHAELLELAEFDPGYRIIIANKTEIE